MAIYQSTYTGEQFNNSLSNLTNLPISLGGLGIDNILAQENSSGEISINGLFRVKIWTTTINVNAGGSGKLYADITLDGWKAVAFLGNDLITARFHKDAWGDILYNYTYNNTTYEDVFEYGYHTYETSGDALTDRTFRFAILYVNKDALPANETFTVNSFAIDSSRVVATS